MVGCCEVVTDKKKKRLSLPCPTLRVFRNSNEPSKVAVVYIRAENVKLLTSCCEHERKPKKMVGTCFEVELLECFKYL